MNISHPQFSHNYTNKPNFQSANPLLKEAEKVIRLIDSYTPTLSPSRIKSFKKSSLDMCKRAVFMNNFIFKEMVREPFKKQWFSLNPENCYINLIKNIKDFKLANCGELSVLTNLLLNINGIKSKIAKLIHPNIDHDVVLVPIKQNPDYKELSEKPLSSLKDWLVADSWLHFADTAISADQKYKSEYYKFVKSKKTHPRLYNVKIFLKPDMQSYQTSPQIFSLMKTLIAKNFPEFIIEKDKPLIKH